MAAVSIFYAKVIADELTRDFFAKLDMEAQAAKQTAFMVRAFGGPSEYAGRDLRTAHRGLVERGLRGEHFDAVLGHLRDTLHELGIAPALIDEVMVIVGATRAEVLDL